MHKRTNKAFTIVELAVVILVIGILTAVGIFAYSGWRERTAQSELKSDLGGVATAMDSSRSWSNGYPALNANEEFNGGTATKPIFTQSENVTLQYKWGDAKIYCIEAKSTAKSSIVMHRTSYSESSEPQDGPCPATYPPIAAPSLAHTYIPYDCSVRFSWTPPSPNGGPKLTSIQVRINGGAWEDKPASAGSAIAKGGSQATINARSKDSAGRLSTIVTMTRVYMCA